MVIIDTLKNVVQGESQTYQYRCQRCDARFQSETADMGKVDCPECGTSKILSAR